MNHQTLTLQQKTNYILDLIVKLFPEIDSTDHWHTVVPSSKLLCIGIIAFLDYNQNHSKTLFEFKKQKMDEYVLHPSNFSRRTQRITELIPIIIEQIALFAENQIERFPLKQIEKHDYVVDTKPIPICQNLRIFNCHLAKNNLSKSKVFNPKTNKWRKKVDEDYRGYCASKNEYYYGFKLNLLQNCLGIPREYSIHTAKTGDIDSFKPLNLNLPEESIILADKAYNDTEMESYLQEEYNIKLNPIHKKNNKKMENSSYAEELAKSMFREKIETTFSFFTDRIKAVCLNGFVTKIHLKVLAYSFLRLFKLGLLGI